MKNKLFKNIMGLLLIPLFLLLYFIDRAICVLIPIVNSSSIKVWFNKQVEIQYSIIRVVASTFLVCLFYSIKYLISLI